MNETYTTQDPELVAIEAEARRRHHQDVSLCHAMSEGRDGYRIDPAGLDFWREQVRAERAPKVSRQVRRQMARKAAEGA